MKYRNNLILSNQFHEKNREINVELFSSNLISRKKFREINFSFNFTLHRYFSKMNYVNAFFPSFFGDEGLGGFRNVSKMNYVNTFFPSFFGAEGLGAFRNVSKMNYVNTFFPSFFGPEGLGGFRNVSKMNYVNAFFSSFFDSRFSLLSIDKITSHNLKKDKKS